MSRATNREKPTAVLPSAQKDQGEHNNKCPLRVSNRKDRVNTTDWRINPNDPLYNMWHFYLMTWKPPFGDKENRRKPVGIHFVIWFWGKTKIRYVLPIRMTKSDNFVCIAFTQGNISLACALAHSNCKPTAQSLDVRLVIKVRNAYPCCQLYLGWLWVCFTEDKL